jgi:hypothetical protein
VTDLSHQAITGALQDTLAKLNASQQAVKQAAATVYQPPPADVVVPPAPAQAGGAT